MPTQIHAIILPLLGRTTSHSLACYTSVYTWRKFCLAYQAQNSPHREILYTMIKLYYDPKHSLGTPWHRYTMPTQIHAIILPLLGRTTSHNLARYTSVYTWHKFCLAYQAQNSPHREILYYTMIKLYYDPRHLLGTPWHRYTMPTQIHAIILP